MRVTWLAPTYPWPGDPVGGVFHQTQARALAALGAEVRVVAPSPWSPWPLRRLSDRWRRYAGTPLLQEDGAVLIRRPRFLAVPGHPDFPSPDGQMSAITYFLERSVPDVIHAHFATPYGLAGTRLKRAWRRPLVLTLHGSDVNVWPSSQRNGLVRFARAVLAADSVIAVSKELANRTYELVGRLPKVMPVGVDLTRFNTDLPDRTESRSLIGLPSDRTYVTFVGGLTAEKGVRELAKAAEGLPENVTVMLVGDGPLRDELRNGAAARSGQLLLRGRVANTEIPALLRASDALVLPSRSEGLPTVLVEAGACGVPVVATAVGGIPDLLGEGRGWLIADFTADAIADALQRTISDPAEAVMRARRLLAEIRLNHDSCNQARLLLDEYRALV
jgi:teichuronic acid biosynthesis glycosyltransferase TuaC